MASRLIEAHRRRLRPLVGAVLLVAVIAVGCGSDSGDSSQEFPITTESGPTDAELAETAVKEDALKGAKAQHDVNFGEVEIKAGCKGSYSPFDCRAFLFSQGLPDVPLTSDRYTATVTDGTAKVKRNGISNIQIFLTADAVSDCSGAYLKSSDPRDLLACVP